VNVGVGGGGVWSRAVIVQFGQRVGEVGGGGGGGGGELCSVCVFSILALLCGTGGVEWNW